jgi:NAD(P)-dependent dehydrogenase (short-subunit alcohol dehydrogenase family)
MPDKIALITGANRGIGLEAARQLAQRGIHVIIGCRRRADGEAATAKLRASGASVEALKLDVTRADDIAAAAQAVATTHGRLDILVNNAGILDRGAAGHPSEETLETWHRTFETNVFGMIAVTQAFLPLLKKSDAGRIVNLTSGLASLTQHSDPGSRLYPIKIAAYNVSKTAVNAWTVQLAWELRDTSIKVNAADPGHVKTDMGGADAMLELPEGAETVVDLALLGADGPTGAYSHRGKVQPW